MVHGQAYQLNRRLQASFVPGSHYTATATRAIASLRDHRLPAHHPVSACNNIVVPAIAMEYRAPSGFTGQDQFSLVFGDRLYSLRVKGFPSTAAPGRVSR